MGMGGAHDIQYLDARHLDDVLDLRNATDALHRDLHPRIFQEPRPAAAARADLERYLKGSGPRERFAIGHVEGGRVQGYALCRLFDHPADDMMQARQGIYIRDIAVQPDKRERGLATALLQKITELARTMGENVQVHAGVWGGNDASNALFRAAGYQTLNTSYALFLDGPDGA